jgi:5-(carboxyamino)imidazole ribonucleotide mutase
MKVWIIMGSESDREMMSHAEEILKKESIPYETYVHSAHREPEKLRTLMMRAHDEKVVAIIAGAGLAAHLPGFIASLALVALMHSFQSCKCLLVYRWRHLALANMV